MHPRELTDLLIQRGMWSSQGKTPAATVSARIYDDIKKHGSQSRFVKVEGGLFALNPKADIEPSTAEHHMGKTATKRQAEKSDASYSFYLFRLPCFIPCVHLCFVRSCGGGGKD